LKHVDIGLASELLDLFFYFERSVIDEEILFVFNLVLELVDPGPEFLLSEAFFWLEGAQITDKGSEDL
jgi:hypothetical protein